MTRGIFGLFVSMLFFAGCGDAGKKVDKGRTGKSGDPYILVLGIAQDAGYPQAGCAGECCLRGHNEQKEKRRVSSLGLVDPATGEKWVFDATPDFKEQLHFLNLHLGEAENDLPDGIFLSHGHMGHYTGLIHFGREAMGSKSVPVYTLPRMAQYLTNNGPWSQLVSLENISLNLLRPDSSVRLNDRLSVVPFLVPHRDEFTETAGFIIKSGQKSVLFIPDIDKWDKWERDIKKIISEVDVAFIDGTFYRNGEIPGRDMSEIPHPFITESMAHFGDLSPEDRKKVYFIHFNHTNPVLKDGSPEQKEVLQAGFRIAGEGQKVEF